MANALLSLGLDVRYVGALGNPSIHPVFEEFAKQTDAISLTEPGITTALEFKDGKIMLGNMVSLEQIDYNWIIQAAGEGAISRLTFQMRSRFHCKLDNDS